MRSGSFFTGVDKSALDRARQLFARVDVDYGTTLTTQGEDEASAMLILEGEVAVRRDGVELRTAVAGEMIGETELFGRMARQVTTKAVQPTKLLVVDPVAYRTLRDEGSSVAAALERLALGQLAAKLRITCARIAELRREHADVERIPSPGLTTLIGKGLGVWGRKPAEPIDKIAALKQNPSLARLDDPTLEVLARMMRTRTFRHGRILCRHGEEPDELLVLVDGRIDVLVGRDDDRAEPVATLEPAALFGVSSVFENRPRMATCRAQGDVTVLMLSRTQWEAIDAEDDDAANAVRVAVAGALARQLEDVTQTLARLEIEERRRIKAALETNDDDDDHDPTLHDLAFGR